MPLLTQYNPAAISVGPGVLYIAPVGAVEPTTVSSTYDAAFVPIGYTDAGHTFTYDNQTADVPVAESLDPILVVPTGRVITIAFAFAEISAKHLQSAIGGGTITTSGGTTIFNPPAIGVQAGVCLAWDSFDQTERMLWRNCIATGSVAVARQKAPAKATLPASFRALQPTNPALQPFTWFGATSTRA